MASQNSRSQAEEPVANDDSSGEEEVVTFKCDVGNCTREFGTKIGLGVHKKSAHPVEANEAIDTSRKRARWNIEEVTLLAKAEAKATREGVGYMNLHLEGLFPERSLEAIKKRRQLTDYRELVTEFLREDEVNIQQPASSSQQEELTDSEDLKIAVTQEIQAVIGLLVNPNKLTKYLIEIANDALLGRSTGGRLSIWLSKLFPNARTPKGPNLRLATVGGNRRHRRRQEYNELQKLYKKDRGAAARQILDEPGNNTMPSREDMVGFWTQIFSNERVFDSESPDAVQEKEGLKGLWSPIQENEIWAAELDHGSAAGPDGISVENWMRIPILNRKLVYNIILLEESLEDDMCKARTVFLPKDSGDLDPGQFRPLSIMSVVVRQFNKILSRRFLNLHKFDERQKAFINR